MNDLTIHPNVYATGRSRGLISVFTNCAFIDKAPTSIVNSILMLFISSVIKASGMDSSPTGNSRK